MNDVQNTTDSAARRDPLLGDLIRVWWTSKWPIVAVGALGFVLAAGASLLMKPVYRGTVTVAAAEQREGGALAALASQFSGLPELGGLNLGSSPNLDQSLAVLQSVPFTQRFLVKERAFPQLFGEQWDPATKALRKGSGGGITGWLGSLRQRPPPVAV